MKTRTIILSLALGLLLAGCGNSKSNYVYYPGNWNYDDVWSKDYQTRYDRYPEITNRIATYNYGVLNQEIKPEDGLRYYLFDDSLQGQYADFFADYAKKIVPGYQNMGGEEKALRIYDWLCTHVYYDNLMAENDGVTLGYTLQGMKLNSKIDEKNPDKTKIFTVCRGYCDLLCVMLNGIGVPCIEDTGREYNTMTGEIATRSDHVWNEIYYDNAWHMVDATWESNVAGNGYWYDYRTQVYKDGTYNPQNRQFFDIIPDYSSWEDCRNYTNYHYSSHIVEYRNDSQVSNAQIVMDNGYVFFIDVYDAKNGKAELKGYVGSDVDLSTPTEFNFNFDYQGGKVQQNWPIVAIADRAFDANKTIKKVKINTKSGLDEFEVKRYSFRNTNVESITFDAGVTLVHGQAFSNSGSLTELVFEGKPVETNTNSNFIGCANTKVKYNSSIQGWESAVVDGKFKGLVAEAI